MAEFRRYMHIERFGNDEVQGIELGECYVFPKLDGTNASVWISDDGYLQAGSRNRHLSLEQDNAGFFNHIVEDQDVFSLLKAYPHWILYGEWLVPHSLKTYRDSAWRTFYVFDVYDTNEGRYLHYDEYAATLDAHSVEYLTPLAVYNNVTYDNLLKELEKNNFLIKDGEGTGEGVVVKNYSFENRFGRTVWAKVVSNEFKEQHTKVMGAATKEGKDMVEEFIARKWVTPALVDKVYAKIVNEENGWNSKFIPRLLNTVYYDLIREESWSIIKETKNPTINYKTLNTFVILRIKQLKPELF